MSLASLWRLVFYAVRYFPLIVVGLVLSLVSVAIELAAISALFPLAEAASGKGVSQTGFWSSIFGMGGISLQIGNLLIVFLALLTLRAITLFSSGAVVSYLGRRLVAHFSSRAFTTFIRSLTFSEVNQHSIGYFINLAGDEANRASQIIMTLLQLFPAAILSVVYFAAIAYKFPSAAAGMAVFLGLAGISLIGSFKRSHRLGVAMTEQSRALGSHFLDSLNSLRSVRAMTAEEFVSSRYCDMLDKYARTGFAVDLTNMLSRYVPVLILLTVGAGWTIFQAKAATVTEFIPLFIMLLLLMMRFFPVVGEVLSICLRIVADLKAGHDISHVLERSHEPMASCEGEGANFGRRDQIIRIEFRGVGFSYSNGREVLRDVSFILEAGRSYSLAGASGAGKSTIIDLLLGFYAPQRGSILINGFDLRQIAPQVLRSKIVVLEQQARIFNDTVYNNIAFGRQTNLAAVKRVSGMASVDEDIEKLPNGYETIISYQGGDLSGGQRQRIGIARGFLGEGDVLVLDESTNALDEQVKQRVIENVLSAYGKRIVVFVTHDQALAQRVDVALDLASINQCT